MLSSIEVISSVKNFSYLWRTITSLVLSLITVPVLAQSFYVSGTFGLNNQQNSSNSGQFVSSFTTGEVTGFTPPVNFAQGSPLGWETDFSDGETYSFAFGYSFDSFRIELAHHQSSNNVSNQSEIVLGGLDVTQSDAGLLFSGNTNDFGINTGTFFSGSGRMETTTVMLNAYYDFDFGGDTNPYIGVGIGNAEESVVFASSDSNAILRDKENGFAWQVIGGVEYQATQNVAFFGQYRYFQADEPTLGLKLLPGSIDLENKFQAIEIGLRYSF